MKSEHPKSLEELRRLYVRISRGESTHRIGKRSLKALRNMLNKPNETAAKSITEIAEENSINISTVTRMAQNLGFDGFQDLKHIFKESLLQRKNFYSEQVRLFLNKESDENTRKVDLLQRIIQDEWSNIMLMTDQFDHNRLKIIAKQIVLARRVIILGLRSCYSMAFYLNFYLKMLRDNVDLIGESGHTLAEDLSAVKKGDLLIAISVNPYTRATLEAARVAREYQGDVVSITDSIASPLANETEYYIITPAYGNFFFSPIVSQIICVEALLSEIVNNLGDEAIERLNKAEATLERMGVEIA